MAALSRGAALLMAFFTLALSTQIIHEEGRCLWYGQCTDETCPRTMCNKYYNLFNNSYYRNVTQQDDAKFYALLEEMCPMYIGNDSIARVCCDDIQLQTLKDSVKVARSLLSRCPACLKNFIQSYCVTTCDPNQSLFMNGTIREYNPSGKLYEFVASADVYLTEKYATDLFDSCQNVQNAGGGSNVMILMCGTANCSPQKWLDFLGDPTKDGCEAPFPLTYHLYPNATPIPGKDGITPLDDVGKLRFHMCNESVDGQAPCSCSDCPSTCPLPPSFPTHHLPFKLIAIIVGSTGFLISTSIFVVALVYALCKWTRVRKSGYEPISTDEPPRSAYGSTGHASRDQKVDAEEKEGSSSSSLSINSGERNEDDEDEDEEGVKNDILYNAMAKCCYIGHLFEFHLKQFFYRWGRFVARFWYLIFIVAALIIAAFSCGLLFFTVTTDPVKLWSAPNSRARLEKDYFDSNFGPFYRTEQIIIKAKSGVDGLKFQPSGQTNTTWTFGPVFNQSLLIEVLTLQNHLANMQVLYHDAHDNVSNITLQDICFSPLAPQNQNCTIMSVLNYFQNDLTKLKMEPEFHHYNSSYHIHYCTRNPFSTNEQESFFNIPCLGAYGGDIDPNIALGGFQMNANGYGYNYDTATVLIITFVVVNHVDDRDNKMAMAWEKAFLGYLHGYKERAKYIDIVYSAERSIIDEINRESETDIYTIAASYLLMFLYITIFLGHIRSFMTILVDMKLIVGLVGVLLVLAAVTSSLGIYSYAGIEGSLIVLEVVPFLVLAVGVDNLFILVHSYERQTKKLSATHGCDWSRIPTPEIIGRTVSDVAPSLLLTGLSETAAFLLGGVSVMPAVRTFSLYAGTAVFFNLVLQLTVFVAVLSLDAKRQLTNRMDIFCCVPLKGKFDPRVGRDVLSFLMKYFAKFILSPLVRPFVLLIFGLTFTGSVILLFRIKIGLDQNLALPKDSYLIPYFDQTFEYLHTGAPVYFVIKRGINYTKPAYQNKICSGTGCNPESLGNQITIYARNPTESGIAESPLNWIDTYFAWVSGNGGCCGYYNTSTPSNPDFCDSPESGTECIPCIPSSRPNATEFGLFLEQFLSTNPSTSCATGGHAAFGGAVILADDNETVITSYVMTYHNILQDSPEFINALKRARQLSANVSKMLGDRHEVFPYSVFYVYYEQYLTVVTDMMENIGLALLAVFVVSFLMMGLNLWAAVIIIAVVISIMMHMLGSMAILGINANAVSLVNLVMAVGISVEFCSHIVRWFVSCPHRSRKKRAHSALQHVGTSVVSGITMTKFLGVFVLLFAKSQLFEIYYFRMYMCMLLWGALHGLVLLPVLLSYVGPPYFPNKLSLPYSKLPPVATTRVSRAPVTFDPPSEANDHQGSPPPARVTPEANNYQSYSPPTHTTPETNVYQGYPPPTHTHREKSPPRLYPSIPAMQPPPYSAMQYPSSTPSREPWHSADERSRLLN